MPRKLTTEEFIKRAKIIHGDKYDYSNVAYIKDNIKICIICKQHGAFMQIPQIHINGAKSGCPKCCFDNRKITKEAFIKQANLMHKNKYDYSNVSYINCDTKVCIICPIHGEFWQSPNSHYTAKQGCPSCGIIKRSLSHTLTTKQFIRNANLKHNFKYDYSETIYKNGVTKIKIICPIHNITFMQTPSGHMSNGGCPKCKQSKGESKIDCLLHEHNIKHIHEHRFEDCKNKNPLPFDFYIPKLNLIIEYNGAQHYYPILKFGGWNSYFKVYHNDIIKHNYCVTKGIKLLEIPYWELKNINIKTLLTT